MRALVLSDIHGSSKALRKALRYFEILKCDRIWLLGDILCRGSRIDSENNFDPNEIVELLHVYKDCVVAVRGNCDSTSECMKLPFPSVSDSVMIQDDGLRLFLSHGHLFSPMNFWHYKADAYLFGHTHIYTASENSDSVFLLNPGSVSFPRGGHCATFGFYADKYFSVRDLETGIEKTGIALKAINDLNFVKM